MTWSKTSGVPASTRMSTTDGTRFGLPESAVTEFRRNARYQTGCGVKLMPIWIRRWRRRASLSNRKPMRARSAASSAGDPSAASITASPVTTKAASASKRQGIGRATSHSNTVRQRAESSVWLAMASLVENSGMSRPLGSTTKVVGPAS